MPQTSPCWPRNTLKDYLNGSSNDQQLAEIERHVAQCEACEQTLLELERDPDTLLVAMRGFAGESPTGQSQADSAVDRSPSIVERAVDAVKGLTGPANASPGPLEKTGEIRLQQIGAYDLLQPLGRGGMGLVMLARHRTLKKQVAIKMLPRLIGDRPELVQRFQREIVTAGWLNHPSIVHATDAGAEQGMHYLVMEYIEGLDLSRIARLIGMLPIADACELIRQTALGLSYAHAQGVVHRDIKPSNLMLDKSGHVKILDFGLAQLDIWEETQVELTTVGQLMGTLDYMAPEQAERAGPVDYRADLYALGATLFRLLAGRAPLAASPNMTLLEKVRLLGSQSAPLVSTLRGDCPASLVKLIEQLLSRDPALRPASAAHVAEALTPHCAGHQVNNLLAECERRDKALPGAPVPTGMNLQPAQPTDAPPPRNRGWILLACLAPLFLFAGIVVALETQKGQLIIESEVSGVKVNLLADGQVAKRIEVKTGTQATRLFADKYAIEIESASDSVFIDDNYIEIHRGQTVVARIQQARKVSDASPPSQKAQPLSLALNKDANVAANARSSEPMYAGQTLAQWLDVLERDLDSRARLETLPAIRQLVESGLDAEMRARVAEALCAAISSEARQVDWNPSLWRMDCTKTETLSRIARTLVVTCGPQPAFDLLRDKCLLQDGKITKETFAILRAAALPSDLNEFACRWLLEGERFHLLDEELAWLAFDFLERSLQVQNAWLFDFLPKLVLAHPHLGHKALLQLRAPDGARTRAEMLKLEESIAATARNAFLSNDSPPAIVALAAARLARTAPIGDSFRAELVEKLAERLEALSQDQTRLLAAVDVNAPGVPNYFNGTSAVELPAFDMTRAKPDVMNSSTSRYFGSELVAMLALIKRLQATRELDVMLTAITERIMVAARPWLLAEAEPKPGEQFRASTGEWPFEKLPEPSQFSPETWRAAKLAKTLDELGNVKNLVQTQLHDMILWHRAQLTVDKFDKDGDGQLSRAEKQDFHDYGYDKDGDRLISMREYFEHLKHQAAYAAVHDWMTALDANRNGSLSKAEAIPSISETEFAKMDANQDGSVSVEEMAAHRK